MIERVIAEYANVKVAATRLREVLWRMLLLRQHQLTEHYACMCLLGSAVRRRLSAASGRGTTDSRPQIYRGLGSIRCVGR